MQIAPIAFKAEATSAQGASLYPANVLPSVGTATSAPQPLVVSEMVISLTLARFHTAHGHADY